MLEVASHADAIWCACGHRVRANFPNGGRSRKAEVDGQGAERYLRAEVIISGRCRWRLTYRSRWNSCPFCASPSRMPPISAQCWGGGGIVELVGGGEMANAEDAATVVAIHECATSTSQLVGGRPCALMNNRGRANASLPRHPRMQRCNSIAVT